MARVASKNPDSEKFEIRKKRRGAGLNSTVAVILAFAILLVSNILSSRLYFHQHFDNSAPGGLSPATLEILNRCRGEVRITALFEGTHPYKKAAYNLLRGFSEAAALIPDINLETTLLDVNRDLVAVSAIMHKFNPDVNSIIIEYNQESRVISEFDMTAPTESQDWADKASPGDASCFRGEYACINALSQLLKPAESVIYFLEGHGEFDIGSYHHVTGASSTAQALRSNGLIVETLNLAQNKKIPTDCSALVIAGPRTMLTQREIEQISSYLSSGGKAVILLDNPYAGGLAPVLEKWGIQILQSSRSPAEREFVSTTTYGVHQTTRRMNNIMTVYAQPCHFTANSAAPMHERADKPQITPIVLLPAKRLMQPEKNSAEFYPIVLACELGGVALTGRSHNTRLVVFGDSEFVSNEMVNANVEGNIILFLSCIEWLLTQSDSPILYKEMGQTLNPGIDPVTGWFYLIGTLALFIPSALLASGVFIIMPLIRRI